MKRVMYVMGMLLFLTAISSCSDDAEPVNGKDGISGKDGKDGKNGRDGKDGKDCNTKHNQLILFGDVTNEEAKEQIKNFSSKIYSITVANTTQLTELDLSKFEKVNSVLIQRNKQLRTIRFDNLTTVYSSISIDTCNNLRSVDFPMLTSSYYLSIQNNRDLKNLNFPNLTNCDNIVIYDDNANLRYFDFSKLSTSKNIVIGKYQYGGKQESPMLAVSLLRSLSQKNTPLTNASITVSLAEKEKYKYATEVEGYVNIFESNGNTVDLYWLP